MTPTSPEEDSPSSYHPLSDLLSKGQLRSGPGSAYGAALWIASSSLGEGREAVTWHSASPLPSAALARPPVARTGHHPRRPHRSVILHPRRTAGIRTRPIGRSRVDIRIIHARTDGPRPFAGAVKALVEILILNRARSRTMPDTRAHEDVIQGPRGGRRSPTLQNSTKPVAIGPSIRYIARPRHIQVVAILTVRRRTVVSPGHRGRKTGGKNPPPHQPQPQDQHPTDDPPHRLPHGPPPTPGDPSHRRRASSNCARKSYAPSMVVCSRRNSNRTSCSESRRPMAFRKDANSGRRMPDV